MSQEAFLERLGGLETRLTSALEAMDSRDVDPELRDRAAGDLKLRLEERITLLRSQRRRIEKNGFKPAAWITLSSHAKSCASLFAECLAFVQGGMARKLDADHVCSVTDALLDALARDIPNVRWGRFSVLATEEFFVDLVQIIRVRFPPNGVWDVPVAAHEFGHFVAGQLNRPVGGGRQLPFQDYRASATGDGSQSDESWRAFLDEYFADVYATYALGPAYASSCLELRFDPAKANDEGDREHPAYATRAYVVLQTLRRMNQEKDTRNQFSDWIEALDQSWHSAMDSVGQPRPWPREGEEPPGAVPNALRTRTDGVVSTLYEILKASAPAARYNSPDRAYKAASLLEKPPKPLAAHGFSIVELLNAAWIRRGAAVDTTALSTLVLDLSRLVPAVQE